MENKIVAVVTPKFTDYLKYIRETNIEGEKYTWIYSVKNVRGILFDRVEKLHNFFHIKDIDDIMSYLESHTKIPK